MSPLRSSAGPAVCTNATPSSSATMRARLVLPRPGGPANSTWSSASPRAAAAAMETPSCPSAPPARRSRRAAAGAAWRPARPRRGLAAPGDGRRPGCGWSPARLLHVRRPASMGLTARPLSAWAMRSSGAPGAPSSSCSASAGLKPRPTSPSRASSRGSLPRMTTIGSPAGAAPTFSRSSTTIRSAVRLPIPGTAWRRAKSPAATAASSSRGLPPESTARATFGPTPWTPMRSRKRSRSASVAKPWRSSASSRTMRCVCSVAGRPAAGTCLSVSAETASR